MFRGCCGSYCKNGIAERLQILFIMILLLEYTYALDQNDTSTTRNR